MSDCSEGEQPLAQSRRSQPQRKKQRVRVHLDSDDDDSVVFKFRCRYPAVKEDWRQHVERIYRLRALASTQLDASENDHLAALDLYTACQGAQVSSFLSW
jgi:hypothetical protein